MSLLINVFIAHALFQALFTSSPATDVAVLFLEVSAEL